MRTIISSILMICFHQLLTGVTDVTPQSTGNNCTQNSIAVEDEGSAYSGVKLYFGDSFCQRIIQEDVTNAVKNACSGTSNYYNSLTSRIDLLDKKIENTLQRLGALILGASKTTCTKGYEYYRRDKFWYKFHSLCRNWVEARLVCHEEGGDLISLKVNNFEFFKSVSRSKSGVCSHVWVGATDIPLEGTWKWLNGENVRSTFWETGQPDNFNNSESCGDLIRHFGYKLNDNKCSNAEHFICQIVKNN